jgi:hypothetical protein
MQTQPQVAFDDVPADELVRDAALDPIAAFERFWHRITGCHVVNAQPHVRQLHDAAKACTASPR